MPRGVLRALGVVMLALSLSEVQATDIAVATWPRIFAQPQGIYAFKIVPKKHSAVGEIEGVFFTFDEDGADKVVWRRKLVDRPGRAMVLENSKYVVTVDEQDDEHSLVLYGEAGKVLANFQLQDLLTDEEIAMIPVFGGPIRFWDKGMTSGDKSGLGSKQDPRQVFRRRRPMPLDQALSWQPSHLL